MGTRTAFALARHTRQALRSFGHAQMTRLGGYLCEGPSTALRTTEVWRLPPALIPLPPSHSPYPASRIPLASRAGCGHCVRSLSRRLRFPCLRFPTSANPMADGCSFAARRCRSTAASASASSAPTARANRPSFRSSSVKTSPTRATSSSNAARPSVFCRRKARPSARKAVLTLATSHAEDEYAAHGLAPKAKRILKGLAFRETDFDKPARTFSGGWVMRAHLARLLTQEPDLLMLDEPTNHLDLEALALVPGISQRVPRRDFDDLARPRVSQSTHREHRRDRPRPPATLPGQLRPLPRPARRAPRTATRRLQGPAARDREACNVSPTAFRAKASLASQAQSKLKQIARMEKSRPRRTRPRP